jgi:hypothetical protein
VIGLSGGESGKKHVRIDGERWRQASMVEALYDGGHEGGLPALSGVAVLALEMRRQRREIDGRR